MKEKCLPFNTDLLDKKYYKLISEYVDALDFGFRLELNEETYPIVAIAVHGIIARNYTVVYEKMNEESIVDDYAGALCLVIRENCLHNVDTLICKDFGKDAVGRICSGCFSDKELYTFILLVKETLKSPIVNSFIDVVGYYVSEFYEVDL